MAEDNKAQEVELDTDGVNEENVNVPEAKEPDESFAQKENVDLGYTDVTGGKTAKELLQETKDSEEKPEEKTEEKIQVEEKKEDLQDYSEKVKKRIDKLTFQIREAERREKAALEYAKGLKNKYDTLDKKFEETDTNYLKEYDSRIDAEREKVKNSLRAALESNDVEKITEAQDALSKLSVEKEKVSLAQAEKKAKAETPQEKSSEEAPPPPISQKAQKWAETNEWFGTDRVMTGAAMSIHEELMGQGIDAETDEYYNEINKRMKEYFPQKFAQDTTEETKPAKEPVQNVGSVSRRSGGRKSVRLTKSQVVIAKKLGVPLEEYAKYVKEGV
jgi:uncharacterized phage infection (PIP) family protein YhgE|tara:strand:+ start:785 stop:1777 length:993 start_codon:yes stop_codon:yes gene_type:complete